MTTYYGDRAARSCGELGAAGRGKVRAAGTPARRAAGRLLAELITQRDPNGRVRVQASGSSPSRRASARGPARRAVALAVTVIHAHRRDSANRARAHDHLTAEDHAWFARKSLLGCGEWFSGSGKASVGERFAEAWAYCRYPVKAGEGVEAAYGYKPRGLRHRNVCNTISILRYVR